MAKNNTFYRQIYARGRATPSPGSCTVDTELKIDKSCDNVRYISVVGNVPILKFVGALCLGYFDVAPKTGVGNLK